MMQTIAVLMGVKPGLNIAWRAQDRGRCVEDHEKCVSSESESDSESESKSESERQRQRQRQR